MTGTKKILRLFLIITACLAIFCIVTPVYASALDTLDLQLPFGELPASLTITGSTIGEYVRAIFLFGSAMLFAVAVVAIMYGGVLWTISGAIPNQIDVAKRTIVQAIVGIFIASFAIFVLQIVSPGTILLQPISPTAIQGIKCCQTGTAFALMTVSECTAKKGKIVSEGSCAGELTDINFGGATTDNCPSSATINCGVQYKDPAATTTESQCTGKKCENPAQKCQFNETTQKAECAACLQTGGKCTSGTDNPCCSNTCSPNGTCVDSAKVDEYLGKSCSKPEDCAPAGLVCNTNWGNKCTYGRWGAPCDISAKAEISNGLFGYAECDYKDGFYCSQQGRNSCLRPQPYGRCDPNPSIPGTKTCPTGYKCVNPYLCNEENPSMGYAQYKCKNDVIGSSDQWSSAWGSVYICIPDATTCLCHQNSNAECNEVKYTDNKPTTTNDYGDNVCLPANLGSPCESNDDCFGMSGKCNDDGPNICVKGEVGDGCDDHSDCISKNCCEKFSSRGICVPANLCK